MLLGDVCRVASPSPRVWSWRGARPARGSNLLQQPQRALAGGGALGRQLALPGGLLIITRPRRVRAWVRRMIRL